MTLAVAENRTLIDRIEAAFSFEVAPSDVYATGRTPPSGKDVYFEDAVWESFRTLCTPDDAATDGRASISGRA